MDVVIRVKPLLTKFSVKKIPPIRYQISDNGESSKVEEHWTKVLEIIWGYTKDLLIEVGVPRERGVRYKFGKHINKSLKETPKREFVKKRRGTNKEH